MSLSTLYPICRHIFDILLLNRKMMMLMLLLIVVQTFYFTSENLPVKCLQVFQFALLLEYGGNIALQLLTRLSAICNLGLPAHCAPFLVIHNTGTFTLQILHISVQIALNIGIDSVTRFLQTCPFPVLKFERE